MGGSQSALDANPIPKDSLDFVGRNGNIYANAQPFSIKGVNWFGSEAYCGPPNGLEKHGITWYLDFLQRHNFNAIRLLFNHEHILKNDIVAAPQSEQLLFQTRYIDMFVVLAREAAKRGMLVMIGCHRITHEAWPGDGLWYGQGYSESRVLDSWTALTKILCNEWNVFGADLQNEPHASSWGKGLPTDWNKAAERIGNHIHEHCPRWMIMVEGVGYTPGAPGADRNDMGIWWGENLVGTNVAPVQLRNQDKLVYAPHVYGPSVYMQSYFRSPFFPTNMPQVWQQHFAFAKAKTGRPIVLGEIGGNYIGADKVWQDWAIPYMIDQGFGLFYFALNPDSKDTGGLVPRDDWSDPPPGSPEALKLKALAQIPSTDVFKVCPSCRPADAVVGGAASPPPAAAAAASHPPPPVSTNAATQSPPPPPPPPTPLTTAQASPARLPSGNTTTMEPAVPFTNDQATTSTFGSLFSDPFSTAVAIVLLVLVGMHVRSKRAAANGGDDGVSKVIPPVAAVPLPAPSKAPKKGKKGKKAKAADEDQAERVVLLLQDPDPELAAVEEAAAEEIDDGMAFDVGDRVRVRGLTAEPWHNGAEGTVAGHAQTPSGPRINVVLQDGTGLCLRAEMLERCVDDEGLDVCTI